MFPVLDYTSFIGGLQGALSRAVNAGVVLMLKLGLLWFACWAVAAFLPRWFRPLVPLVAVLLVLAYPAQMSALGDAAVGLLARAGLVPQVSLPDLASAAPAGLGGLSSQVEGAVNSYVNWIVTQLGI